MLPRPLPKLLKRLPRNLNQIMTTAITTIPEVSPAVAMIQAAMQQGMAPEQLREFIAARREWEEDEARKLYSQAIADFQSRCPIIEKGDKAHNKQYAAMDRIWRTIRPLMDETGLSIVWTVLFDGPQANESKRCSWQVAPVRYWASLEQIEAFLASLCGFTPMSLKPE